MPEPAPDHPPTPEPRTPAPRGRRTALWAVGLILPLGLLLAFVARQVLWIEGGGRDDHFAAAAEQLGELTPDQQTILTLAQDPAWMDRTAAAYAQHCARCHGRRGQGMSAPNLTDDRYVNVQTVADIYDVIANGRNHNAMPAWKRQLQTNEMVLLSAYVTTLRGKGLQGRPVEPRARAIAPWPELEAEIERAPKHDPAPASDEVADQSQAPPPAS